jgi:hypothetical protein
MPKRTSKRKPRKVTKRKPKKVTKRKTKRKKRRRRRFGSSLVSDNRTPIQVIMGMIRGNEPIADTNIQVMKLARGEPRGDASKFMKMIGPRGSGKKVAQINRLVRKSGALMAKSTSSPQEKKEIFHTVVVAIVSLLYQLLQEVASVERSGSYYKSSNVSVSTLNKLQQAQSYAALTAVSDDTKYKELTNFEPIRTDKQNVIGFKYKYENNDISVSMIVTYDREEDKMVAQTFIDDFRTRIDRLSDAPQAYKERVADYETEIRSGLNITSTQTDNNETITTPNDTPQIVGQVEELLNFDDFTESVGVVESKGADVDDLIQIPPVTTDDVDLLDFSSMTITPSNESIRGNLLLGDGPKDDKDDFSDFMPEGYKFGRRKRKKKVSKKKGPSAALKKLCKRLKVKLTVKRGKKRVYKSEKVLKAQCKKAAKKSSFGKKKTVSKKKGPSAALKKLCKRLKVKLTVKRGKKRVYKSEKVLKVQCKKAAKKSSFGKKKKRRRRKRTSE